jgi:hypothetical protein
MSESKSGFEIRADLLSQAQGVLQDNASRQSDSIHFHNELHPESKKSLPENPIYARDIIGVAKELYEFVNEK